MVFVSNLTSQTIKNKIGNMNDTPIHMYPKVPPTKQRNREEKFRLAKNVPFWHFIANIVFPAMLKARFYAAMIKGKENAEKCDKRFATIFYANHTNWWDGLWAYCIVNLIIKNRRFRFMIEEMNRFPLFQYIGCFPINKKSSQSAIKSLNYAVTTLDKPNTAFWIFPQGIIRPPHYRPEIFQSGLAYMAEKAIEKYGGINLVPVANSFMFLRQDRPEIITELGEPLTLTEIHADRKTFTHELQENFEKFLDKHDKNISLGEFEGYHYVYKQKLHWWRAIEQKLKSIGIKEEE
ncbi:MAG: lysophospholipid acyltransferase family protein [Candidatus Gastranaerophilales bacterium]|nr:lysophospholipid acyltransferase family protein [Candidatus Gastranaerophilales bacterium]